MPKVCSVFLSPLILSAAISFSLVSPPKSSTAALVCIQHWASRALMHFCTISSHQWFSSWVSLAIGFSPSSIKTSASDIKSLTWPCSVLSLRVLPFLHPGVYSLFFFYIVCNRKKCFSSQTLKISGAVLLFPFLKLSWKPFCSNIKKKNIWGKKYFLSVFVLNPPAFTKENSSSFTYYFIIIMNADH